MRDIRFMMNHLSETRKKGNHKCFEQTFESIGYKEVAPPFNDDYDPKVKIESDSDESDDELSETSMSEGVQTMKTKTVVSQDDKSVSTSNTNQTPSAQTS